MKQRLVIRIVFFLMCLLASPAWAVLKTPVQYETEIRAAFRQDDWSKARTLLDEAEPEYGTLSAFCEMKGHYFYHFQQYDMARRWCILALRDDASNTQALEILVRVERETGNYATAISHVNSLLEFSPYNARLWRQKIELYRFLGNDLEANRLLERLYAIYPEDTLIRKDVIYQQEQAYYAQRSSGNLLAQEKSLRSLIDNDPTNADHYYALTNLLLQQGRKEEALAVASQGYAATKSGKLRRKRNDILGEERDAQIERDTLLQQRTAKLSATLVMEAIHADAKEKQIDPDVIAARKLQEVADLIVDQQYDTALVLLSQVDTLTLDPDLLASSARRRTTCLALIAEKQKRQFIGDAIDSSYVLLKRKEPESAIILLDSVLVIDPKHNEAHYLHSLADERLHNYDSALYHLSAYHPLPEEVWPVRRHLHTLEARTLHNSLTFEYQLARRTSVDVLNHNAYLNYTHNWEKDELAVSAAYAGRESTTEIINEDSTAVYGGGTGVQLGAAYTHTFDVVAINLEGRWSNRFFPRWMAQLLLTEELPKDWTLMERISWRRLLSTEDDFHLLNLGLVATKNIGQFNLSGALDVYGMLLPKQDAPHGLGFAAPYFNGSVKMQYFPFDGDRSHVFASVGVGNAPETSILNSGIPLQFNHLNTYVALGGYWVFGAHLAGGFSASHYTMGAQAQNSNIVRNYIYFNANLQILF